jgi:hypothetical protein
MEVSESHNLDYQQLSRIILMQTDKLIKDYEEEKIDWKICQKNSASPAIILTCKKNDNSQLACPAVRQNVEDICCKIWIKYPDDEASPENKALNYEAKIYKYNIRSILRNNPNAPFLSSIGDDNDCSTVETLINFLGVSDNKKYRNTILLTFFILKIMKQEDVQLFKNSKIPIDFTSRFFTTYFLNSNNPYIKTKQFLRDFVNFENTKNLKIGAIIFPRIKYTTFADYLMAKSIDIPVIFDTILQGLYTLFQNEIVHNDLHAGNIMIDEEKKPLIFDWDRSFSFFLRENPQLSDNICSGYCRNSQCNLFLRSGRPIDLLKILRIIAYQEESVLFSVLEIMKIKNTDFLLNGVYVKKYKLIYDLLREFNIFFLNESDKCSDLYRTPLNPRLKLLIDLLGRSWNQIMHRKNSENPDSVNEIITESGFAFTDTDYNVSLKNLKSKPVYNESVFKNVPINNLNYRYIENILSENE